MTTRSFDPAALERRIHRLPERSVLVFSLVIAERMWPNYLDFVAETGWGDGQALRRALDAGWAAVLRQPMDRSVVAELEKQVDAATPDTEEFDTISVSSALDAAVAAADILRLLAAPDPSIAIEIASLSRDTVDMYVQHIEGLDHKTPDLERRIGAHRLMQTELEHQARLLDLLEARGESVALLAELCERYSSGKESNLV